MNNTTCLDLKKPETSEAALIGDLNDNMDTLDAIIGKIEFTDGSSSSLSAGMLVYISAANTVQEADATDKTKPAIAVCRETDGSTAKLKISGVAKDVQTVGAADIAVGDKIYLSTTAGKVTKTKPTGANNLHQLVGYAIIAESANKVDIILTMKSRKNLIDLLGTENIGLHNLIKNGSFEDSALPIANTPSGWILELTSTNEVDTGTGWGVPKAIKITGTGAGNEGLKQTLSGLKANTKYYITWDSKATAGDTARLFTTGATTNADTDITDTSWKNSTTFFITDGSATDVVLKIVAKADGDIVWFDNINVAEGSAPFAFSPHPNDEHLKTVDYQGNATNYDYSATRMEVGWGFIQYTGGGDQTKVVTFGTAFKRVLMVRCSDLGALQGSDPSAIGDLNISGLGKTYPMIPYAVTTSQFIVALASSGATNARRYGFSWMAIGID